MSLTVITYLLGMALLFVGERLVDGIPAARWTLDVIGVLALGASFVLRYRSLRETEDEGLAHGQRVALALQAVGGGSLLFYVLSTDATIELLSLSAAGANRWSGAWGAIWPLAWLVGTLPLLLVDRAIETSPVVAPPRRIKRALSHGLAAALGIALVFPLNYIASRHTERWDLAYFEAARPGSATQHVVDSLPDKVHVRVFMAPHSEVRQKVEAYFDELEGDGVEVSFHDQAAEPALARRLKIRDNGEIAFTLGTLESGDADTKDKKSRSTTEILELGKSADRARRKLRDLDTEVRKHLVKLARGQRTIYLTAGHGELGLNGRHKSPMQRLETFKKLLEAAQFESETITAEEGLAERVPNEADIVLILSPKQSFLPGEIAALRDYLERGGSVLVAVEPERIRREDPLVADDNPVSELLDALGVEMLPGVLAANRGIVPIMRNKSDRQNLLTNEFSSHPSTAVLSRASRSVPMFTPSAGRLAETSQKGGPETVVAVRSPRHAWPDLDGDLKYDPDEGEKQKKYPIAIASTGGSPDKKWRAMTLADASLFTDVGLRARGNQQFVYDTLNWLLFSEELSGTIESEKDVRIRHSQEDQTAWFYGTVLGIPLLLFAAGAARLWWRKNREQGGKS